MQSWWGGFGLSLPAGILLRNVSSLLSTIGISEEVSQAVQECCSAVSYGVIPSFLCTSDLLFAQGSRQSQIILVMGTLNACRYTQVYNLFPGKALG